MGPVYSYSIVLATAYLIIDIGLDATRSLA